MVQQVCTEHLWGRIVVTATGEKPKRYTVCLNCGIEKPRDDQGAIMEIAAAMRKFHIEENLKIINRNEGV